MREEEKQFRAVKFADVLQPLGEPVVDMVTLDAVDIPGGLAKDVVVASPAVVAAKALQHELHHITLAVVRRGSVGEDEQLHATVQREQRLNTSYEGAINSAHCRPGARRHKVFSLSGFVRVPTRCLYGVFRLNGVERRFDTANPTI